MKIQNIWAVGRNYSDHAKEMGQPIPAEPMIFLKSGGCLVQGDFKLPTFSNEIHHELELAVQFDDQLNVSAATLALDLTARDLQAKLKSQGHPWTLAKSFRNACPVGTFFKVNSLKELENLTFSLKVNGEVRQSASTRDMIFKIADLAKYIVERFPVQPGDLLLTGTPAGVGPIKTGDKLEAEIPQKLRVSWRILP